MNITAIANKGKITKLTDVTNSLAIVNLIYPVGATFISFDASFNPNTAYTGTTWELQKEGIFIEATQTDDSVGKETEAGAPEISGSISGIFNQGATGSLHGTSQAHNWRGTTDTTINTMDTIYFNASRSSSIYGKSKTIQPYSVKAKVWKRTA